MKIVEMGLTCITDDNGELVAVQYKPNGHVITYLVKEVNNDTSKRLLEQLTGSKKETV